MIHAHRCGYIFFFLITNKQLKCGVLLSMCLWNRNKLAFIAHQTESIYYNKITAWNNKCQYEHTPINEKGISRLFFTAKVLANRLTIFWLEIHRIMSKWEQKPKTKKKNQEYLLKNTMIASFFTRSIQITFSFFYCDVIHHTHKILRVWLLLFFSHSSLSRSFASFVKCRLFWFNRPNKREKPHCFHFGIMLPCSKLHSNQTASQPTSQPANQLADMKYRPQSNVLISLRFLFFYSGSPSVCVCVCTRVCWLYFKWLIEMEIQHTRTRTLCTCVAKSIFCMESMRLKLACVKQWSQRFMAWLKCKKKT